MRSTKRRSARRWSSCGRPPLVSTEVSTSQAGFDFVADVELQAEREKDFGDEKDRCDENLEEIVREGGFAAFEDVADQLQDPPPDEEGAGPDPARGGAGARGEPSQGVESPGDDRRRDRERDVEKEVIREHRREKDVREREAVADLHPAQDRKSVVEGK